MIKITRTEHYIYYQSDEGYFHRPNGPAIINENGTWAWWLFGGYHRYYGSPVGNENWYIHVGKIK